MAALYDMKPYALAALAGASCLLATYSQIREGSIVLALMVVAIIGAVSGLIAMVLSGQRSNLRVLLLISAFTVGALVSEAVTFVHYYLTYGFQDPKFSAGVAVSIMEFGVISVVGGFAMLTGLMIKRRITLRSGGTAQKRATP
jgi:hypothetical protein